MTVYDKMRSVVMTMLRDMNTPSPNEIKNHVDEVIRLFQAIYGQEDLDAEKLYNIVISQQSVWVGVGHELKNDEDHVVWLPDKKANIQWKFWKRYEQYLQEVRLMPDDVVSKLGILTDSILGHLEDPKREGKWDRRGMVVGQVQSGKTSNYTGLICKAVDAGYKLIIVLAGMNNDLRSQTQLRLDEGFLGFDTQMNREYNQMNRKLGVGELVEHGDLIVHSLTSSEENGDYRTQVARNVSFMLGGDPVLLVVKKNSTVLKHLLRWIQGQGQQDCESGEIIRNGIPMLMIDDEADNASVDGKTSKRDENGNVIEDTDPTTINGLIRQILKTFQQSSYVGYTATPFANIFIYPIDESEAEKSKYGKDLFPESFIISLPAPSNYIGPVQLFGLDAEPDSGIEEEEGLPVIKTIHDSEMYIPSKHKKDWNPIDLPNSLKKAIRTFILACAARNVRGQEKEHKSMLIHVTRFTAVQESVAELVSLELDRIKRLIEFGSGNASHKIEDEFKKLWCDEFVPITKKIINKTNDPMLTILKWEDVRNQLFEASSKIQVRTINGYAKDTLDYRNHQNGMSVIAIGGDKLSRGLTLEGLMVSYYLRASKMYDTLMQMGRWFGYRPGYLDMCRLYTTKDLIAWYKHISKANEELVKEFEFMADSGATPRNYGLKVRTHPEGLQITATNKIRNGTNMKVSFSRGLSETVLFHLNNEVVENNFKAVDSWILNLGAPHYTLSTNYQWRRINGRKVIEFLESYITHPLCRKADKYMLIQYITKQININNELENWTVVLKSKANERDPYRIAGLDVGLATRNSDNFENEKWMLKNSRLIGPTDEYFDLMDPITEEKLLVEKALEDTISAWKKNKGKGNEPTTANGVYIRQKRDPKNGLLVLYPLKSTSFKSFGITKPILGFAISFPESARAQEVEYTVNTTYWTNLYGEE